MVFHCQYTRVKDLKILYGLGGGGQRFYDDYCNALVIKIWEGSKGKKYLTLFIDEPLMNLPKDINFGVLLSVIEKKRGKYRVVEQNNIYSFVLLLLLLLQPC